MNAVVTIIILIVFALVIRWTLFAPQKAPIIYKNNDIAQYGLWYLQIADEFAAKECSQDQALYFYRLAGECGRKDAWLTAGYILLNNNSQLEAMVCFTRAGKGQNEPKYRIVAQDAQRALGEPQARALDWPVPPVRPHNRLIDDMRAYQFDEGPEPIRNDVQNVHEHHVSDSIKRSIVQIKKKTSGFKAPISHKTYLLNKDKALEPILTHIENNTTKMYNADNYSLNDILELVWNRINCPENNARREDLISSLMNSLKDCSVNGGPVCATGIMSRLVQSLEKIDADEHIVDIKPLWAIREEMLSKAAAIRTQEETKADAAIKELLKSTKMPTDQEEKLLDEYQKRVNLIIIETLNKEYVNSGILDNTTFKHEIGKWNLEL